MGRRDRHFEGARARMYAFGSGDSCQDQGGGYRRYGRCGVPHAGQTDGACREKGRALDYQWCRVRTLPDVRPSGAWILADTKPAASAINSPTFTLSPLATFATAGAPICCDKGTFTTSGNASTSTASARLNLLSDGCTPPLGNVFIAFVFGFIVRIRIRFFQSSSPPKPASLPLPTFASMQERL